MIVRISDVDPRSEVALSLLRKAANEVRPLYGESPGPPWPQNVPLGPRDVYIAAFEGETPVACGAIRELDAATCELHRMYVASSHRRRGLARAILSHLHTKARDLRYRRMRLETGNRQRPAISLYEDYGFSPIEPFGEYVHDPTSVCYELQIDDQHVEPAG